MEDQNVYRLEGSDGSEIGGLVIVKKPSEHTFKKPQLSLLGLDKLAEKKRRESSLEPNKHSDSSETQINKDRKYRSYAEETPTHTGGINTPAREKMEARLKRQRLDKIADDKERNRRRDRDRSREKDRYKDRDYDRHRHREKDRNRDRNKHEDRGEGSSRRDWTPRFGDEPRTPKYRVKDSTSKTSWDDNDEEGTPRRRSTWDYPTPNVYSKDSKDMSIRSEFTPSYKYNSWAKERKTTGATPMMDEEEKELWEQEQKR